MKIGVSLPVRELRDDIEAIRAFAQTADELGFIAHVLEQRIADVECDAA